MKVIGIRRDPVLFRTIGHFHLHLRGGAIHLLRVNSSRNKQRDSAEND